MPVPTSSVQVGEYFITATDQLRKVTNLSKDAQGRDRVHYLSKSAKIMGRQFDFGHTISNPPLLDTFANGCDKQLSAADVDNLRKNGIILSGE